LDCFLDNSAAEGIVGQILHLPLNSLFDPVSDMLAFELNYLLDHMVSIAVQNKFSHLRLNLFENQIEERLIS
jgi:hypothetical protein